MAFHLYRINEIYADAGGTIQFVELAIGNVNGESFWAGQSIRSSAGGSVQVFVFPGNLPSTATANTKVLLATQGFAAATGLAPDFVLPDGFLSPGGGTLNFAGVDAVSYPALPADGVHSVDRSGAPAVATPQNFAGATASLPPPVTTIVGTAGDDTLAGTAGSERIEGLAGDDRLLASAGDDTLDGGDGLDTVVYALARGGYTLRPPDGGPRMLEKPDAAGVDRLPGVERLRFADLAVALDLDGAAGTTAKVLGAVFGPAEVANPVYAGIGLFLLDGGMDRESLVQLAIDARLGAGASHAAVVELLYTNVVGVAPSAAEAAAFVALLDGGTFTVAGLGVFAAESEPNQVRIDLAGLAAGGLEYLPFEG